MFMTISTIQLLRTLGIMESISYKPLGDGAILIELGNKIDPEINERVHSLSRLLSHNHIGGVLDIVPGYATVVVHYDALILGYEQVVEWVKNRQESNNVHLHSTIKVVEIPTIYGGKYGPDLPFISQHTGLDISEIIKIHAQDNYLVYMMGFMPGFPYLGGMDPRIATPRLAAPRQKVPAGSIGIAGNQTGIYSIESPGGWRLIGWTPIRLFDPDNENPFLLAPGDSVRFVPIEEIE
jgi:inhibitor of KinA